MKKTKKNLFDFEKFSNAKICGLKNLKFNYKYEGKIGAKVRAG